MKNIKFLVLVWIILSSIDCQNKQSNFDNDFLRKSTTDKPELIITSNSVLSNKLKMKGDFYYFRKHYKIDQNLFLNDSIYSYNKNNNLFLFDFSDKKRTGKIIIDKNLILKTSFFMDISSNNQKFRFFKVENIDKYFTLNISRIYIANYNYGIVGELFVGSENNEWFSTNSKGYIPNQKVVYSIFKKAKLE